MKTSKIILPLFFAIAVSFAARATVLFEDASNYPYADGLIAGQGQWYCYSPSTPNEDAFVTNNVLLLNTTNKDEVAAPTNGWVNPNTLTFASFRINVSQLPATTNGGYFCQLQNDNDTNDCCHIFIDTRDTSVPGAYRLGIANFSTSFAALQPPENYPQDLATGVWYNVVISYDINDSDPLSGATLWINPSEDDYMNALTGGNFGDGFVFGTDTTGNQNLLNINISQIGFSPYADAGISNVIAATTFDEVNSTHLPAFGIQPQSGTNYSGNPVTFYAVASGVDVTYQWYSTSHGALSDGANYTGSQSDTLVVNSVSASDSYYCVVTDVYGNTASSETAYETVITTPTAPFFPTNVVALDLTNNLFTTTTINDTALGTGPLYYQWYFAPTNTPTTFSAIAGQNGPILNLNLSDYTYEGNYYVSVSNAVNGGSIAVGPTNSLTEIAPSIATIAQLHNFMISMQSQIVAGKTSTINVNTNTVTVGGYVTTYGGFGSSYTEFFIQDAAGYGIEVYLGGDGNTNTPPVGTYVIVSGPVVIYHTELEIEPASLGSIVVTNAPVIPLSPVLSNVRFDDLSTNGLGTNAMLESCSLITFTNVYIYGSRSGAAIGHGGIYYSNSFSTAYFTAGAPYPVETNMMEIYQYGYDRGPVPNGFDNWPVPTYCAQLTGAYLSYGGTSEILPSRLEDYVTNLPPAFAASVTQSKGVSTISWPAQVGPTYSIYTSTNLLGPWLQSAYGLAYYPTNGVYTDTNRAMLKFYKVGSP